MLCTPDWSTFFGGCESRKIEANCVHPADECVDFGVFLGLELYEWGDLRDAADENGLYEAAGVLLTNIVSMVQMHLMRCTSCATVRLNFIRWQHLNLNHQPERVHPVFGVETQGYTYRGTLNSNCRIRRGLWGVDSSAGLENEK